MIDDDPTQDFWEKNIISGIEWVFIKVSCSRVSLWDLVDAILGMNDDGLFKYDLWYEKWDMAVTEFWVQITLSKSFCILSPKQNLQANVQFDQHQNNFKTAMFSLLSITLPLPSIEET